MNATAVGAVKPTILSFLVIPVLAILPSGATRAASPFDDAVGYWKLDYTNSGNVVATNVTDSQPNPLNGTSISPGVSNLVWTTVPNPLPTSGKPTDGAGIVFDEKDSILLGTAGVSNKVHGISGDVTVYARLKLDRYQDDGSGNNFPVFTNFRWNGGASQGFGTSIMANISTIPGALYMNWGNGVSYNPAVTTPAGVLKTNQWADIFWILDPNRTGAQMEFVLYQGAAVNVYTYANTNAMVPWTAVFDPVKFGGGRSFPGTLESIAVWDRALTMADINQLIPEPAAPALLALGLALFARRATRRNA